MDRPFSEPFGYSAAFGIEPKYVFNAARVPASSLNPHFQRRDRSNRPIEFRDLDRRPRRFDFRGEPILLRGGFGFQLLKRVELAVKALQVPLLLFQDEYAHPIPQNPRAAPVAVSSPTRKQKTARRISVSRNLWFIMPVSKCNRLYLL
jgi:hypothetical protein